MTYPNYYEAFRAMEDTIGRDCAALGDMSIAGRRAALDARLEAATRELGFTASESGWFRLRAEFRRAFARPWAYETACVEAMIAVAPEALELMRARNHAALRVLLDSSGRSSEEIDAAVTLTSIIPNRRRAARPSPEGTPDIPANLSLADVQAGVRSAVYAWLDANGEDITKLIAATVAEATVKNVAAQPSVGRIERVANQAHKKLIEGGPQREYQVKSKLAHRDRSVVRDALRYLEDQGRATYDGTRWNAAYKGSALCSPSAETTDELAGS